MVRVLPKNDALRKLIRHPTGGPFHKEGPAEWPDDSFTARRIADGDITVEQVEKKEDQPAEQKEEQPADIKKAEQVDEPAAEKVSRRK